METGIHELTAGYALDALDDRERRAYEKHLEGCHRCRDELAAFYEATAALALAASGPEPSPALRGRILAAVREESRTVVPLAPRRRRLAPALAAVAAAAALLAVALGVRSLQLSGELDEARASLAVLGHPQAREVALASGRGRLVVAPDGRAVLVLDGLDPAPAGKAYELWVVERGRPAPAGLFRGRPGADVVLVEGTVDRGDVVAVTVEDERGAERPTGEPIVASRPV